MNLKILFENCAYNIVYKQIGDSVNYAFVEDGSTLYIYFQGSNSITDWVRNFLFKKKPYKDMETPYKVHRGFLAAWKEVEDLIIKKITERVLIKPTILNTMNGEFNPTEYKWKKIVIVGYSHGGALAAFCHECVWYYRADLRVNGLEGYGFEAPRIYGGFKVKKELKERWEKFTVIRCNNDIVTHCPPFLFRFTHVGKILKIKGDTNLVTNCLPKFIKSHYPEVVLDGLRKII